jgi:hypothetical protein
MKSENGFRLGAASICVRRIWGAGIWQNLFSLKRGSTMVTEWLPMVTQRIRKPESKNLQRSYDDWGLTDH